VSAYYSVPVRPSLDELLADPSVAIMVNLTDPHNHFDVSRACLEAGKHVYSEKPMAMTFSQAKALVELANARGLHFSSAPCSVLGETAQTAWKALRNGEIGTVRLVYANYDDGPRHLMEPNLWRSVSGAPSPYRTQFEVGCTLEHGGYWLSWIAAFFGPATSVTAFSACVWPDKRVVPDEPLFVTTPDFSLGCITFQSGVVARVTYSVVAPYNHALQIVGERGVLTVDECWNYTAPVKIDRYSKCHFKAEKSTKLRAFPVLKALKTFPFLQKWVGPATMEYPAPKHVPWKKRYAWYRQDLARGVADMADALREHRPARLRADYCLHVAELMLAIHNATSTPYRLTTTFEPLQPLDDAELKRFASIDW
jgi:predicted dehydrogenase